MIPLLFGVYTSGSATIINIPADYPTIQQGIDASSDGDTVLVQPGTYVENVNFNGHNIVLGSLFLTTGDTSYIEQTVIDGDSAGTVVWLSNHEDNTTLLCGFTITNGFDVVGGIEIIGAAPTISHNIIKKNHGTVGGGGIDCYMADPIICYNEIKDNLADVGGGGIFCYGSVVVISYNDINNNTAADPIGWGGGIFCMTTHAFINNNIIHHNNTLGEGGGLRCMAANPVLINNLFFANMAASGGGVCCTWSNPKITNCIFWSDFPSEILIDNSSSPEVIYCDIEGGCDGVGNIYIYPLFRDTVTEDFHLMSMVCGDTADSRCIDAGDPNTLDLRLDCRWGMGVGRGDMGAYGGGDSLMTPVNQNQTAPPGKFVLLQNYPNPFNPSTTLGFNLTENTPAELSIFNLLGQKMAVLINGQMPAGEHMVSWDASGYPSGIYLARLRIGGIIVTRKMLFLK